MVSPERYSGCVSVHPIKMQTSQQSCILTWYLNLVELASPIISPIIIQGIILVSMMVPGILV